jgi:predicted ATPase/signal transduction histidine kinase
VEIPGYRELEEIHRGYRYLVLRGLRLSDGREVILKTVTPGPLAERHAQGLIQEHALLHGLELPGVVRALALEGPPDTPRLVLEDAGPHSLHDWLKRRALDPATFLRLAVQLAETLAALHARRLVHGDLNPSNVVLDEHAARTTLIDFDVAARVASGAREADTGTLAGTLAYLAPEQTGRLGRVVDHRADLYALGVTFYQMLTGAPPFVSADPVELVHAHLARPPVPPATLDPKVPALLSQMTVKLLAKMPEDRYQSAEALAQDLRHMAERWQETGRAPLFELGRRDQGHTLALPPRLYGRERELGQLVAGIARAAGGGNELHAVSGPAGAGKSALVHEAGAQLPEGRGAFVWGKFDQLRGDVPYAALAEALRRLVRAWLEQPPDVAQGWRQPLLDVLGRNARVVVDVIPELGRVLGETPAVPELGPIEAESRFHLTFAALVKLLCQRLQPLVVLMDDAQWADPASLRLVGLLVTDPDIRHLLVALSFRNDEVEPGHPLLRTLDMVRAAGTAVSSLALAPLDLEAVAAMCVDTLRVQPARVAPLAQLVQRKTAGNAFFARRFLLHLHQTGLLRWEGESAGWQWDTAGIEAAEVTENVLDLMARAIRRLPEPTQRLLEMAACFRRRVDVGMLAQLAGASLEETARQLWAAVEEGLLVADRDAAASGPAPAGPHYRFVHDRVQQAAYSLPPEEQRLRTRLRIGRLLMDSIEAAPPATGDELDRRLFEVVDQLRPAVALIDDPAERLRLAWLTFKAGDKSRSASAYPQALAYLTMALDLFPPEARHSHRPLLFRVHRDALQLALFTGDEAQAARVGEAAAALAGTAIERAQLLDVRMVCCSMRGAYPQALAYGREALAQLGVTLPDAGAAPPADDPAQAARAARVAAARPEQLLDLPRMSDPLELARAQVLANMLDPAYVCDLGLMALLVAHLVDLSLRHGNAVSSAFAYTVWGMLVGGRGDHERGHAFGRLGVELARRFGDPVQECRALDIFGTFVNHWRAPLGSSLPRLRLALTRGLEGGDLHYALYADYVGIITSWHKGTELGQIAAALEKSFNLVKKIKVDATTGYLTTCRQATRCLQGRTRARGRFDDDGFDEQAHLAAMTPNPIALWLYHVLRLQAAYLLGDLGEARRCSQRAQPHEAAVGGLITLVDHNFYTSLVLAGGAARGSEEQRARLLAQIALNQQQLAAWAAGCPENFRHKHLLVAAEAAALKGSHAEAAERYDQAIDAAQREGFLQDQALGSELAGRFYRAHGRRRVAEFYLRAAMDGFSRWGAMAKVNALEEEFPHLAELPWRAPLPTIGADGKALDLLSLLKAAATISGEVVLDRLLEKLLAICCEVGGAARGALVLEEGGSLVVRAVGPSSGTTSLERTPLAASADVPRGLIARAHRDGEPVLLPTDADVGGGTGAGPVDAADDPYLRTSAPRSAVALPIQHHARAIGVLYLENNLAAHTFTAARLRVLRLLSSQIAVSLENSRLFGRLSQEIEERKRAEAKAHESVRLRDEFLTIASHELKTPVTSLKLSLQVLAVEARGPAGDRKGELMDIAERQVQRLASLIEDLLDVSRIQAGRLSLSLSAVELGTLVGGVLDRLRADLTEARCPVSVRASGPIVGRWDSARLEQVVVNLLSNAVKFGRGSPIEIELSQQAGAARLSVSDHGIGIPSERLAHVFERFERAVPTTNYGGLGLGLYITREIVTALGGSIRADSRAGAGATFVVTLPVSAEPAALPLSLSRG